MKKVGKDIDEENSKVVMGDKQRVTRGAKS